MLRKKISSSKHLPAKKRRSLVEILIKTDKHPSGTHSTRTMPMKDIHIPITRHEKEVSPDKFFFVWKGPTLRHIVDLKNAIIEMNEEQLRHHTMEGRNDFANWIKDVFGEKECAKRVALAKTKKDLWKAIDAYFR